MEDFLLWLLLFSCLCLAANAGRGRLSGGRERGACHFWSHSAIQRKPSLKSPGNSNLPSARHRGQQGRAGLSGLCPSQGFPHRGSEAWREVCLTVGPSGEAGALGALGTQPQAQTAQRGGASLSAILGWAQGKQLTTVCRDPGGHFL